MSLSRWAMSHRSLVVAGMVIYLSIGRDPSIQSVNLMQRSLGEGCEVCLQVWQPFAVQNLLDVDGAGTDRLAGTPHRLQPEAWLDNVNNAQLRVCPHPLQGLEALSAGF